MAPILGKCEKCCFKASVFNMYILNLIDFLVGAALLSFALYLFSQLKGSVWNGSVAWLCWACIIQALMLWLIALFSFCAISNMDCRWAIRPSVFFSGLCALVNMVIGVLGVSLRQVFNNYIQDQGSDIGLSDRDLDTIHSFYIVILVCFFTSVILQCLRIWMSSGFEETSRLIDGEFESILTKETEEWEENFARKKESTQEKYKNLRDYYKNRFGKTTAV